MNPWAEKKSSVPTFFVIFVDPRSKHFFAYTPPQGARNTVRNRIAQLKLVGIQVKDISV